MKYECTRCGWARECDCCEGYELPDEYCGAEILGGNGDDCECHEVLSIECGLCKNLGFIERESIGEYEKKLKKLKEEKRGVHRV